MRCQLDYIATLDWDFACRKTIDDLPLGLSETYTRILNRHSSNSNRLKIILRALTWLIFAIRSLELKELAIAAVIDPAIEFNEEQRLDNDALVLDYCGSLVKYNSVSKSVEISHISITQYFKWRELDDMTNPYYLDESECHTLLLKSCFSWLSSMPFATSLKFGNLEEINASMNHGFTNYAVRQWYCHGEKIEMTSKECAEICAFFDGMTFSI